MATATATKRIFIGNLPCDMTETDVTEKFSKFGNVLKIEIKNSNNVTQSSCYAFLDLEIDSHLLDSCFQKLTKKNWNGHSVKLELAKESFLSRLQRERLQENAKISQTFTPKNEYDSKDDRRSLNKVKGINCTPNFVLNKKQKKTETNVKEDYIINEEIDPVIHNNLTDNLHFGKNKYISIEKPLPVAKGLLQKFESFSDVWKDPPTSDSHKRNKKDFDADGGFEIVSQNGRKTQGKLTRDTNFDSEAKRLKSIEERRRSFLHQKEAVKLALASVDSNLKTNKKIVFDDDIYEGVAHSNDLEQLDKSSDSPRKGPQGPRLFEEDTVGEEEQDYNFNIRRQFEGRKGQKLLDLQSKYANDQRFTLDDRFYESDDNVEDDDEANPPKEGSIEEERMRQIEILQSIVGSNLPFTQQEKMGKQRNVDSMVVHYDPTREDHAKYKVKLQETKKVVLVPSESQERKQEKKSEKKKKEVQAEQLPTVSKEKFYKVSKSLKESLKTDNAKEFSLLKMFGSLDDEQLSTNEEAYSCRTTKKRKSDHESTNPFKWDSSDSEDEVDDIPAVPASSSSFQQQTGPVQAQGIRHESFFFKANDDRLTDDLNFFRQEEPEDENFTFRRRQVQQIVKAKVAHNVRISAPFRRSFGRKRKNNYKGACKRKK